MTPRSRARRAVESAKYWLLAFTLFFVIPVGASVVVGLIP